MPRSRARGSSSRRTRGIRSGRALRAELLEGRRLLAVSVELVHDINIAHEGSWPREVLAVNGAVYFTAADALHGTEVRKTSGPGSAPELVADVFPGPADASPVELTEVDGAIYFAANDGLVGQELWRTDGTAAGTLRIADLNPGPADSRPRELTRSGGRVFFLADDPAHHTELWTSDGVDTVRLTDFANAAPWPGVDVDGLYYFSAGNELWRSDGTVSGTVAVAMPQVGSPMHLTNVSGTLYFTAGDTLLSLAPGATEATTRLAIDDPSNLTNVSGVLHFTGDRGTYLGTQVWKLDNDHPTHVTIFPWFLDPGFSSLTAAGSRLFFTLSGAGQASLWSTGSIGGETQLISANGGVFLSPYAPLANAGGLLYFMAGDDAAGAELWRSDGTPGGTYRVRDLTPGSEGSYPGYFADVDGTLYFAANDGVAGTELWATNGTAAGTVLVADVQQGTRDMGITASAVSGGALFFAAADGTSGLELWRSDGTSDGTELIRDIFAGHEGARPKQLTDVSGTLFFVANDGEHGEELWKSDGTADGTSLVADLFLGPSSSFLQGLTNISGTLYFGASDGQHGVELWKSDGTWLGTAPVVGGGAGPSSPRHMTELGGLVYFSASSAMHGFELWRSDGTADGTVRLTDLMPGAGDSLPEDLVVVDDTLYFSAAIPNAARRLFKSDGTAAGTVPVNATGGDHRDLVNVGGTLYFSAWDPVFGRELWKTDGTAAGTARLELVSGSSGGYPQALTNVEGTLFFTATGQDLWVSNGDASGTHRLLDSHWTPYLSSQGGKLVFSTLGPEGTELWHSDGTLVGTTLLADIAPGPRSSTPMHLAMLGDDLIFAASDLAVGQELRALRAFDADPPSVTSTTVSRTASPTAAYEIPVGSGEQLRTVPVAAMDRIVLTFGEDVIVDADDLTIHGALAESYAVGSFHYDQETHSGTWTLTAPIVADVVTLTLNADSASPVTDTWGNRLDGEWDNPSGLFDPSSSQTAGDGLPGGDWIFRFTVLAGDATRDNVVSGADFTRWSDHFDNGQGAADKVFADGDWDGDGHVTGADYTLWSDHFGLDFRGVGATVAPRGTALELPAAALSPQTLASPAGQPPAPLRTAPGLAMTPRDTDSLPGGKTSRGSDVESSPGRSPSRAMARRAGRLTLARLTETVASEFDAT